MLHNWSSLCLKEKVPEFLDRLDKLKNLATRPPPATWLSQVNNNWERILYQAGTDWKNHALPEEAKALLANEVDLEKMARERKWICFTSLAEAWGM
jgi:hypothetical protein